MHLKLLDQFSVVISLLSTNSFAQLFEVFSELLKKKNMDEKVVFTLFQFLRREPELKSDELLKLYVSNAKNFKESVWMWRAFRHVIHQLNNNYMPNLGKLQDVLEKYAKKKNAIHGYCVQCQMLITVKFEGLTMKDFKATMETIFNDKNMSWKDKLETLLWTLQGGNVHYESSFWRYGDHNGFYSLEKEAKNLWLANEPPDYIVKLFSKTMESFIDNEELHPLISQILLNLGFRSLSTLCNILPEYVNHINSNTKLGHSFLPLLQIFTKMLDPNSNFTEIIKQDTSSGDRLRETLSQLRAPLQKLLADLIPSECKYAHPFHSLSIYECPKILMPDIHLRGSSEDSEKVIRSLSMMEEKFKSVHRIFGTLKKKRDRIPLLANSQTSLSKTDETIIQLLSLLIQISTKTDFTASQRTLLDYIFKCAICNSSFIAQFALYALQFIFITNPPARNSIQDMILMYLDPRLGSPISFTLLSLLYQFMSLPYTPIRTDDPEWFDRWVPHFQATILMQFTTPYIESRYFTYMVSKRFQEVCEEQVEPVYTVFYEVEQCHKAMLGRIQSRFPQEHIQPYTFNEIMCCSCPEFVALYLSEIYCLAAQEKFKAIIKLILDSNIEKNIKILQRQRPRDKNKPGEYSSAELTHSLLLCTLCYRLQMWTVDRLQGLHPYLPYLKKGSFITDYPHIVPLTIVSDEMLKTVFLRDNTKPIIELYMAKDEWAVRFIRNFILTSSPSSLSILMQLSTVYVQVLADEKLDKQHKAEKVNQNSDEFLNAVIEIFLMIANSLDFQVLLLTSRSAMNSISQVIRTTMVCISPQTKPLTDIKVQTFQNLLELIVTVCFSARPIFNTSCCPSLKIPKLLSFLDEWRLDDRNLLLTYIVQMRKAVGKKHITDQCNRAIVMLAGTPNLFEKVERFRGEMENTVLAIASDEDLVTILRENSALYQHFIEQSLFKGSTPTRYATTIFRLYVDEEGTQTTALSTDVDMVTNKNAFKFRGHLITLCLLKLTSYSYRDRYLAFATLKRLLPVYCALAQPKELEKIAQVNGYLSSQKSKILSRTEKIHHESLFELSRMISKFVACLVTPLIDNALACIENQLPLNDIAALIHVLKGAAPYVSLSNLGHEFFERLIDVFQLLDSSIKASYCDIFVAFGEISSKNRSFLSNFIFSFSKSPRIEAATAVLVALNLQQPVDFLNRTVQPFTFQSWFYTNVIYDQSQGDVEAIQSMRLSLKVIDEILNISISHLMTVIHVIIHFCILYCDEYQFKYRDLVMSILSSICRSLDCGITVTHETKFTFDSDSASEALQVKDFVLAIARPLKEMIPVTCTHWLRACLRWAASCGDLKFASKSIVVLSALIEMEGASLDSIAPMMQALGTVMRCRAQADSAETVQKYVTNTLRYLYKVVTISQTKEDKGTKKPPQQSQLYVAQFVAPFIYQSKRYPQAAKLAIKILTEFAQTPTFYEKIPLDDYIGGIASLIAKENSVHTLRFIASYLAIIPDTAELQKVQTFLYILPLLYGAFSAFHCFDPYNSGLSDDFIDCAVNELCPEIIPAALRKCAPEIAEIFDAYFGNGNASHKSPESFLEDITSAVSDKYQKVFNAVNGFWSAITATDDESTYTAVFAVTQHIIANASDPQTTTAYFNNIILRAIEKNTMRALDFLFVVSNQNKGGEGNEQIPDLDLMSVKAPRNFTDALSEIIDQLPPLKKFSGTINILAETSPIPMVPLFEESPAIELQQRELFKGAKFEPFLYQMKTYADIKKLASSRQKFKTVTPTAEDLFVNNNIKWDKDEQQTKVTVSDVLPPEYFLVYDTEIDTFFDRIST